MEVPQGRFSFSARARTDQPALAAAALAGLAVSEEPQVAEVIISRWSELRAADQSIAVGTLVSRPAWAKRALDAIDSGSLPRTALTGFHVSQIQSLGDATLVRRAAELDRSSRTAPNNDAVAEWKNRLTAILPSASLINGRGVFETRCAPCHVLHGAGGKIGPDLTGAARDDLGYLLENILFPSSIVPDEYRLTTLTLKDGRVVGGIVRQRTATSLTLQSLAEAITVQLADVAKTEISEASLMPPGLLEGLSSDEARDLFGFLMSKEPPPGAK